MPTVITNENIRDFVRKYDKGKKNELPEDLRDIAINDWDVSNVTNMDNLFQLTSINEPLNNWNVSNVTTMNSMFSSAQDFDQDIQNWNVSKVTDMSYMFNNAMRFNQPLNNWEVKEDVRTDGMFGGIPRFNRFYQKLNKWRVKDDNALLKMFGIYSLDYEGDATRMQNYVLDLFDYSPKNIQFKLAKKWLPRIVDTDMYGEEEDEDEDDRVKCMTQAQYETCDRDGDDVVCPITGENVSRENAVMLPGENKSCYDRDALRRWVEKNPSNPMTREPIDPGWILKNLREMEEGETCVDEAVAASAPTGGRRTRRRRTKSKATRRSRKVPRKAKHSRKRHPAKGKRSRRSIRSRSGRTH